MEHIFDFESEKNIIGVIDPITPEDIKNARVWICQLAAKRIIFSFRSPQIQPDQRPQIDQIPVDRISSPCDSSLIVTN